MFKRNRELTFTKEAPFKGDLLLREPHIKALTDLILTTQGEFVMTLSSPWGTGKTTFLRMWKAYLESLGYPCVHFNAWETDFAENPFLTFLAEMGEQLELLKGKGAKARKATMEEIKKLGKQLLPRMLSLGTKLALGVSIDFSKLGDDAEKIVGDLLGTSLEGYAGQVLNEHKETKELVKKFKMELHTFVGSSKHGLQLPMFFFVDELDRCKPTYAVQLLETVKHIFEIPGIIFVLSLDREQLAHTVRAAYGEGLDADGYLRRFIDIEYRIPEPNVKQFVNYLASNVYDVQSCALFQDGRGSFNKSQFEKFIDEFSRVSEGMALRTIEKAFLRGSILLRVLKRSEEIDFAVISSVIMLRECDPDIFIKFTRGPLNSNTDLRKIKSSTQVLNSFYTVADAIKSRQSSQGLFTEGMNEDVRNARAFAYTYQRINNETALTAIARGLELGESISINKAG